MVVRELARFAILISSEGRFEFRISEGDKKEIDEVLGPLATEFIEYVNGRLNELGNDLIKRYGEEEV